MEVEDYCYDIPLHESLQALLGMEVTKEQVSIVWILRCPLDSMYLLLCFLYVEVLTFVDNRVICDSICCCYVAS